MMAKREGLVDARMDSLVPQEEKLRVLLIGNNPIQMGALFKDLNNQAGGKFLTETSFTIKDGLKKIQKSKPNCIVIDDSLDTNAIKNLVDYLSEEESLFDIPITLLKDSNYGSRGYNGIQDFILKDGLSVEKLSKGLVASIQFRKTHHYLYRSYREGKSKVKSLVRSKNGKMSMLLEKIMFWAQLRAMRSLGFR